MKYPIGIQDFKTIRTEGGYYFPNRPRRFGKSLFVSMLEHDFMGDKDLFKGVAVVPHSM